MGGQIYGNVKIGEVGLGVSDVGVGQLMDDTWWVGDTCWEFSSEDLREVASFVAIARSLDRAPARRLVSDRYSRRLFIYNFLVKDGNTWDHAVRKNERLEKRHVS